MGDTPRYDVMDMETGQLDRCIFADPAIYQEELQSRFSQPVGREGWHSTAAAQ